jgi:hypothetical protein
MYGRSPHPNQKLSMRFASSISYLVFVSSDDDEVIKRREEAKMLSSLSKYNSSFSDSDNGK